MSTHNDDIFNNSTSKKDSTSKTDSTSNKELNKNQNAKKDLHEQKSEQSNSSNTSRDHEKHTKLYKAWDDVCDAVTKTKIPTDSDQCPDFFRLQGLIILYDSEAFNEGNKNETVRNKETVADNLSNMQKYLPGVLRYFKRNASVTTELSKVREIIDASKTALKKN